MRTIILGSVADFLAGNVGGLTFTPRAHGDFASSRQLRRKKRRKDWLPQQLAFNAVDAAYQFLTSEQREAWRLYSKPRNWNAYNGFMHVNIPLLLAGLDVVYWPPSYEPWGGFPEMHKTVYVVDTSGLHETSSMAWVDVDPVHLQLTLENDAGLCALYFQAAIYVGSIQYVHLRFTVDGTPTGATKGIAQMQHPYLDCASLLWLLELPAGPHEVRLQWKVTGGVAKIYASAPETPAVLAAWQLT
jgi:hypothetical protein